METQNKQTNEGKWLMPYLKDRLTLAFNHHREYNLEIVYAIFSREYLVHCAACGSHPVYENAMSDLIRKLIAIQEKNIELESKLGIKSNKTREGFVKVYGTFENYK